jgi:hypothetical protein
VCDSKLISVLAVGIDPRPDDGPEWAIFEPFLTRSSPHGGALSSAGWAAENEKAPVSLTNQQPGAMKRLKMLVADLSLDKAMLQDVAKRNV